MTADEIGSKEGKKLSIMSISSTAQFKTSLTHSEVG